MVTGRWVRQFLQQFRWWSGEYGLTVSFSFLCFHIWVLAYPREMALPRVGQFLEIRNNWLRRTSLVAQMVKHMTTMREAQVRSLAWEDPL